MPRDSDKNNDSRGRRDRRRGTGGKGRSGAAHGVRRRNSPSAGLPARATVTSATASGVPMPGSPTARSRSARSLIPAVENRTPASATAMAIVRRAGILAMRRVPRGDRPFAGRPPRGDDGEKRSFKPREDRGGGDKRPYTPRGDRPNFNRDDRPPRGIAATMRRRPAATFFRQEIWRQEALYPARRRRREAALHAARRRFSKDGDRPRRSAFRPAVARWRPSRGDRPERKFGGDKKFSRGAPDRGPRKNFGAPTAAIQNRGRSARIAASAIPVPPVTVRAISTSRALTGRATTAAARSVRDFRVRARIARRVIVHFASGRNSIGPAGIATATRGSSEVRSPPPAAGRPHRLAGASAQRSG